MQYLLITDLPKVKVRLNLKRLIDENSILKNQIIPNCTNEIHFTLELHSNGQIQGQKEKSRFFIIKNLFDESIIFNWPYEDVSEDAKITISIWSSAKRYDPLRPLGSTIISLFDENGELRQGKYHLFIWPNVLPDLQEPSTTPGLTGDKHIQTLNFISSKLEQCDKNPDSTSSKIEEALKFKLSYTYRLIPAAFLEVQFPKFIVPVYYADKISNDYQEPLMIEGSITEINKCFDIYDPDFQQNLNDPLEEMFYNIKKENLMDTQNLIPSKEQKVSLDEIAVRGLRVQLKNAEKQKIYKYRYYLSQEKKFLIYYLHSLQFNKQSQAEIDHLLKVWQRIDLTDALYLLSREFSINVFYNKKKAPGKIIKIIRDYAVSIIAELKDQDLIYSLLFLVQSLRYQGDNTHSRLFQFLKERAQTNPQITTFLYWYLKTESEPNVNVKESKHTKDIIQKNMKNYNQKFDNFNQYIKSKNKEVFYMLEQQFKFLKFLRGISNVIKEIGDKEKKKQELRKRLAAVDWVQFGVVQFPMDVTIHLKEPVIQECTLFTSKMFPFKLTFETVDARRFTFIYKSGDDLRQDQLILEMFALMDRLLKRVNQDYKLTPYKALACSKYDGYVEFVPQTRTFQDTNLKDYLEKLLEEKGVQIMNNYVFSCAGYCAITYFFGIGDRHLENLLIDSSGKMLHIDFGFILGRDPKPYPPPIKLRKDMIQAMGGIQHENFRIFKSKCLEAYLYLRKHYKLIYNLVNLMFDSGITDVHSEGISKLYDKLSVNMNDKEAEKHFLMVLEECQSAIAAVINDKIHRWASHFK